MPFLFTCPTENKEPELIDLVASVITAKWQEMGIQLGLHQNDLDTIQLCPILVLCLDSGNKSILGRPSVLL